MCLFSLSGKECQLAAWQLVHKTECLDLARARVKQLVDQIPGGENGIETFFLDMGKVLLSGKVPTASELKLLHVLKMPCKALARRDETLQQWYLIVLGLQADFAGGSRRFPLDSPKAEVLVKEVVVALQEHQAVLARAPMCFIVLAQTAMQLFKRLGRLEGAVILGVLELPGIEAIAEGARRVVRHGVADYMYDLAGFLVEMADQEAALGVERLKGGDCDEEADHRGAVMSYMKLKKAAKVLAKRALTLAEGAGLQEHKVSDPDHISGERHTLW